MKKGFTLIELLAVIVILAIISAIAIPIVIKVIDNVKVGSLKVSMSNIEKAIELYINRNPIKENKTFTCSDGVCIDESNNKLEVSGVVPEEGTINITPSGTITYNKLIIGGYLCDKYNDEFVCNKVSKNIEETKEESIIIQNTSNSLNNYKIYGESISSEYQQVEYIESTGTQYIDTGLIPATNLSVEVEMKYIKETNQYAFNGAYESGKTFQLGLAYVDDNTVRVSMNGGFKEAVGKTDLDINSFHTIKLSNGEQYVNGELIDTQPYGNLTTNKFLLFARTSVDNNIVNIQQWNGQIKRFKVWEDNILIRNFIPCYRKSDGEIGMYDLVNNVFYTNKGTGTFIKGRDLHTINSIAQNVGDYDKTTGKYKIPVKVIGKNLFDKSKWKNGTQTVFNEVDCLKILDNADYSYTIPGDSSTDYMFAFRMYRPSGYEGRKTNLRTIDRNITANIVHGGNYYSVVKGGETIYFTGYSSEMYIDLSVTQLEEGKKATEYEPYNEKVTNIYIDAPLRKVGNYVDYIDYKNQKEVRNVGVLNINSEDNFELIDNYFVLSLENYPKKDKELSISNYLEYGNNFWFDGNKLKIKIEGINTVEELKTWLSNNNIEIYYPLSKSIVSSVELPEIKLNKNYSKIMIETNIKPSNLLIEYD